MSASARSAVATIAFRHTAETLADALDTAPLASDEDTTPEEREAMAAALREPLGEGASSSEILELLAARARREP